MVGVGTALREIGLWREASKRLEVVNQMRLVVIAAGQSNLCPLGRLAWLKALQRLLEAANTTIQLGCQANFFVENLDKSPRTQADLLGHIGDGWDGRRAVKRLQREGDGRL